MLAGNEVHNYHYDEPPTRLEICRCESLAQVGTGTMTLARVSLKTAIKMALLPYPGLPKWKVWRLRHPERDRQQRRANYWRNRDKIALKARESYRRKKKGKLGSTNERRRKKSGREG
jgi:hypothetical protein